MINTVQLVATRYKIQQIGWSILELDPNPAINWDKKWYTLGFSSHQTIRSTGPTYIYSCPCRKLNYFFPQNKKEKRRRKITVSLGWSGSQAPEERFLKSGSLLCSCSAHSYQEREKERESTNPVIFAMLRSRKEFEIQTYRLVRVVIFVRTLGNGPERRFPIRALQPWIDHTCSFEINKIKVAS